MSTGKLVVQTRAARGAMPVAGALVTIFCPDTAGNLQPCVTTRTNTSGSTEPIELDAPSLVGVDPDSAPPFAAYRVDVDHPDYRPVTVTDVAVFSDILTTMPVTMVPPRSLQELNERIIIRSPETGPSGSGSES
ncbi:MAG: hypothetical protein Q4D42_03965 [Eubacteriales bacterium]|nr:hypothetical protein [Eubacteriales bacterium]